MFISDFAIKRPVITIVTMLALVVFGFYPAPLLDLSNPFSEQLLEQTGVNDDGPTVPADASSSEGDH